MYFIDCGSYISTCIRVRSVRIIAREQETKMRRGLLTSTMTAIWMTTAVVQIGAFSPHWHGGLTNNNNNMRYSTTLLMAKRKPSMSERRKQRQAKQRGGPNPFADLPKSKLDIQQMPASAVLDTPEKISDPTQAANKAKELLEKQRASVEMLTVVKERVLALSADELWSSLSSQGYYVVDGFIGNESIIAQMESEAEKMYADGGLEVDMGNLGSGEYTVSIKGGQEQYVQCPRTVEWVVSTTKHIPELADKMSLDSSACMATLRVFDRKAFQASVALLTGSEDLPDTTKPFGTTVTDSLEDKRRLSLQYYLVREAWGEDCGGGLTFEAGGDVKPTRDRLVIWKSDSSSLRKETWKGNEDLTLGSCIELHLVQKSG